MVEKLRQRQQKFQRVKVRLLIFCSAMLIIYLWQFISIVRVLSDMDRMDRIEVMAYMGPVLMALLLIPFYFIAQIIGRWHGEPTADLLLRVINHLREPPAELNK